MNKESKIYVAGHNGLVGSAICTLLRSKGYTNVVIRTSSELDLTDQQATAHFFKTEKPEYVFLAAAKVGGILANNTYRADFIYENLMIQNNVIYQAHKNDIKKLLFLGSTCIYPKEANQPMLEEELLTDTLEYTNEPYAIAKIAGIKMCESYNLQYQRNFLSVMPTNLYGPNDNFDLDRSHVLPALVRKILLGYYIENNNWKAVRNDLNKLPVQKINGLASKENISTILNKYGVSYDENKVTVEIWGSGTPMREFLWSEEMADACIFIMENVNFSDILSKQKFTTQEIRNTHINIGIGKEISIKELANTIKSSIGFKGQLFFNTEKPDGTLRKLTNVNKLHNLGWKHQIEIDEGITKLLNWYKEFVKIK